MAAFAAHIQHDHAVLLCVELFYKGLMLCGHQPGAGCLYTVNGMGGAQSWFRKGREESQIIIGSKIHG
jgi:hypothetical protein